MIDVDTTLSNGMRVLLSVDHEQPRVAARVVVGAGASLDPQSFLGTAHALEHLMANKGTERLGTKDWSAEAPLRAQEAALLSEGVNERLEELQELERQADAYALPNELKVAFSKLGAKGLNATTSMDRTVYLVDVPSNRLDQWAELEADRYRHPVFRGFRMEMQTIVREKLRSFDDAGRAMYQASMAALFPGHPYQGSVLGELDQLLDPDFDALVDYHRRWYVPGNMSVVLSGDLDPEPTLALLERTLGQLPAQAPPARPERPVPPLTETQRVSLTHQAQEAVWLAFRLPQGDHPDLEALILGDVLLANGATGRIDRNLVQPQKLQAAGTSLRSMREAGVLILWGSPRPGQSLEEVEALLREELAALIAGQVQEDQVAEALQAFRIGHEVGLERNDRRADTLVHALARGLDPHMVLARRERLAQVPLPEITQALARWTAGPHVVLQRHRGDPELPELPEPPEGGRSLDAISASSGFVQELLSAQVPPLAVQNLVEGKDWTCAPGPGGPLYRGPNTRNSVAQLTVRLPTGHRHDPVLEQAARVWGRSGVGDLDLSGVNAALFSKGLSIGLGCRAWSTNLSVSGPEEHLVEGLQLAVDRLAQAVLDEADVRQLLSDVVTRRREQKATSGVRAWVLSILARFGADSVHLERLSDAEMLALGPAELAPRVQALLGLERVLFLVAQELNASDLGPLVGAGALGAGPSEPPRRLVQPSQDKVLFLPFPGAQTQLQLVVPCGRYAPEDVPTYRLLDQVLGGSAGLVFQELREQRGLAYAAGAGYDRGARVGDDGALVFSAQIRPDQAAQAAQILFEILRRPSLSSDAVLRAKENVVASLRAERTRFRSVPQAAWSWHRRGLQQDPRPAWLAAAEQAHADSLTPMWEELSRSPGTLTVLGDPEGVDLRELAAIGPVETVEIDALLSY